MSHYMTLYGVMQDCLPCLPCLSCYLTRPARINRLACVPAVSADKGIIQNYSILSSFFSNFFEKNLCFFLIR